MPFTRRKTNLKLLPRQHHSLALDLNVLDTSSRLIKSLHFKMTLLPYPSMKLWSLLEGSSQGLSFFSLLHVSNTRQGREGWVMNISFKYYNKKKGRQLLMLTCKLNSMHVLNIYQQLQHPPFPQKKNRGSPTRNKVNIIGKKEKKINII